MLLWEGPQPRCLSRRASGLRPLPQFNGTTLARNRRRMRDLPPVTQALLIANIAVYLLQQVFGPMLIANFALWPLGGPAYARTAEGIVEIGFMPWQLVTYGFLHGGFTHLLLNCFALYMFGGTIEKTLGTRPFI